MDESNQQLARDLEVERSHHQRLVKEHGRLQQRFVEKNLLTVKLNIVEQVTKERPNREPKYSSYYNSALFEFTHSEK